MKLIYLLIATSIVGCTQPHHFQPEASCTTDSECMELCPEGTRDLRPDNADYCDGGPQ